jgi:hypothetical protein
MIGIAFEQSAPVLFGVPRKNIACAWRKAALTVKPLRGGKVCA